MYINLKKAGKNASVVRADAHVVRGMADVPATAEKQNKKYI